METEVHITHNHNREPMSENISHHNNETHSFYLFVLIIALTVAILQPFAMLIVTILASTLQG